MDNHLQMDGERYDCINRKLSIYDIELGAKDLVMRLDLDVALSKFVEPPKVTEVLSAGKSLADVSVGKTSKVDAKKSENESQVSSSPLGEEENYWKARQMLDHSWIKKTVKELKFCMERMVNRVFLIGNLGDRSGRARGENSMRIIQHALQQHIDDFPIHFLPDANMPDFLERKLADEFHDNCVYVVENLNFHPEEFGTYEPRIEEHEDRDGDKVEEEKADDVGKPASREKASRQDQSQRKLASSPVSEERDNEQEEDAEEEQEKVEEPPFTSGSIHKFKKNLGNLGDVYVNDAPLASLTGSNTVNEIQCQQQVMGMKMTEGLRNIAQFFMKPFPLDVDSIYVKKPDHALEYYKCKASAIIGGTFKSSEEILEKILLANSFLDTFERILFVGELGNVALHALGLSPGKVERTQDAEQEYLKLKEFMLKLFEKSIEKECQILLPIDYVCAEKQPLEDIVNKATGPSKQDKEGGVAGDSPLGDQRAGQTVSKASLEGAKIELSEIQKEEQIEILDKKSGSFAYDPSFKPAHWADAQIFYGGSKTIDLEAQIQKAFEAVTSKAKQIQQAKSSTMKHKSLESSAVNLGVADQSLKELNSVTSQQVSGAAPPDRPVASDPTDDQRQQERTNEEQEEVVPAGEGQQIPDDYYLLGYGPKTIEALQQAVDCSFKLFWDGSVGMYIDTVISSRNNLDVLNSVLEMRTRTNDDEEPPVTLLHGQETEKFLR